MITYLKPVSEHKTDIVVVEREAEDADPDEGEYITFGNR